MLLYVILAASLLGLQQGRARTSAYVLWPFTTLVTMVVVMIVGVIVFGVVDLLAGTRVSDHWYVTLPYLLLSGFVGELAWAERGKPLETIKRRGAMLFDGQGAQNAMRKRRDKAGSQPLPLTVAGVAVPFGDEMKHFKFLGATGTGKSTAIRELLHGALTRGDRAVIADPDGGYLARFHNPARGDVILNPFDARSAKWDLFAELRNAYDVDELAQAFIPDRGSDPTWTTFARTLFSAMTGQAQAVGIRDVGELYRLLVAAPKAELLALEAGTPAAPFLEEGSDKLFQGARSTVTAAVKSLDFVRRQEGSLVSVREWIKTGRGVRFLPYQAEQISALKGLLSIWLRLAIFQTLSLGEGDRRLRFAVDEPDALGAINGLPDALTRLRKCGGRCVLGLQSIAQASTNYGKGPAQTIIENCGNTLILRCSASEGGGTAQYALRLIGEREVVHFARSRSRSSGPTFGNSHDTKGRSEQTATALAVMAAQIEQLPDRTGFLKSVSQPGWMRVGFAVYQIGKTAASFVPIVAPAGNSS